MANRAALLGPVHRGFGLAGASLYLQPMPKFVIARRIEGKELPRWEFEAADLAAAKLDLERARRILAPYADTAELLDDAGNLIPERAPDILA